MPHYRYKAVDNDGRSASGVIDADNVASATQMLQGQRLYIISIEEGRGATITLPKLKAKIKPVEIVQFAWQFATMIDSGIPLLKSLDILKSQTTNPTMSTILGQLGTDVENGLPLGDSMAKHPKVFNNLFVNMVRAAEVGGLLDQVLLRVAKFQEDDLEVRQQIQSSLMYPVMVLIFAVVLVSSMFTFVLPTFKGVFAGMNVEMPATTKFVFAIGDYSSHYWYVPIILVVSIVIFFRRLVSTTRGRFQVDSMKLRIPVIGDLLLKMAVSRFTKTLGVLVASGVPLIKCLEIVGETTGNQVIETSLERVKNSVLEGHKLSVPIAATGLFPSMVAHMIDVGEESGRLSEMLEKVSEFYEKEVASAIKGLTSMIEPALIIFMGGLVGFIAISIMTPMFTLVGNIK